MPVIISAKDNTAHVKAHAFICDRYRRSRRITTNTYTWVYDRYPEASDGSLILIPRIDDKVETTTTLPYVSNVSFNWGQGQYNNDYNQWYSIYGQWTLTDESDGSSTTYDFRYNPHMIIGFKVSGN